MRVEPDLLPSAIEEVLRYRSPLQWRYRIARRDVDLSGEAVPAGTMVLTVEAGLQEPPRTLRGKPVRLEVRVRRAALFGLEFHA